MVLHRSVFALILGLAVMGLPDMVGSASSYSTSKDDKGADLFEKGMKEVEQGDFEDAVRQFEKAVGKDSKNADYYSMLGYSYRKLGDYEVAFETYLRALALDPAHRGAHEYIGEAYVETGNLMMADQHLARLAELCPEGCPEFDELTAFMRNYEMTAD